MVWEKSNMVTKEDKNGTYDLWTCTLCRFEKKYRGFERDLECPKCGGKGLKPKKNEVKVLEPIVAEKPMARIPDTTKRIQYQPWGIPGSSNAADQNKGCTMIVGMCPGRQRHGDNNRKVFHGNRTGDLVEKAIEGLHGIYLTNIFNTYCPGEDMKDIADVVEKGIQDLRKEILLIEPKKIVCLGDFAAKGVMKALNNLGKPNPIVRCLPHPSYVIRFNKGTEDLVKKIRAEVMSR
jgi:uracil-DNA glycosylase family 4